VGEMLAVEQGVFVCDPLAKHIYMPQGKRCRKFCKIYSGISSALKEVETFVNLGFNAGQIENGNVFIFLR
jgi:hypothetical protein